MKRLAGGAAVAAGLVAAGVLVVGGDEAPRAQESATPSRATAAIERRDLVDRETLAGTLGYADAGTLAAGVSGHADRACATRAPSSPAATRCTRSTASRPRSCSTASCRPGATSRRG